VEKNTTPKSQKDVRRVIWRTQIRYETCSAAFWFEPEGAHHRGIDDARNIVRIFRYMIAQKGGELEE
jgi:inhibitor of KinA sporulation pathway (predicted exonuclease)